MSLAAALAVLVAVAPPAVAQLAVETQVPIAPVEGVVEISPELRSRLGLFPEARAFSAGRLFQTADGGFVLEIESRVEGRLVRERRPLDTAGLDELRRTISTRLAEGGTSAAFTDEGRGGLIIGQTLIGLAYHGWAVPAAFGIDSARTGVATYLLTAGAAFGLSYRLSRGRRVTDAHRDLFLYGATRGVLLGVLAGDAIDAEGDARDRVRLGAGVVTSVAASLVGFQAASRAQPRRGNVALWTSMGDMGLVAGAMAAYALGPYSSRTVYLPELGYEDSRIRNRAVGHLITAAGGAIGLAGGAWLGSREAYTTGNVRVLQSAALLGAQVGGTLTEAGTDGDRAFAAGALAGGIVGLAAGNSLLRGKQMSGGEGLIVNAAHVAGAATGLGLAFLTVEDFDGHELYYMSASTMGALLGAGLALWSMGDGSGDPLARGRGPAPTGEPAGRAYTDATGPRFLAKLEAVAGRVRWDLHPEALLPAAGGRLPVITARF